jgi:hypothetical protein
MARLRRGGFRVQDAMIAIAAMAFGLALVRVEWQPILALAGRLEHANRSLGGGRLYEVTRVVIKRVLLVSTAAICPLMVMLLLIARRRDRRAKFWRVRRPGAVACLTGTIVLSCELVHQSLTPISDIQLIRVHTKYVPNSVTPYFELLGWNLGPFIARRNWIVIHDPWATTVLWTSRHTGLVVAGAWLALILARAWRPEPSWSDRAGRMLGVFWIVSAAHFFLLPL